MGMILRIASSRIVGQGDIVGRSGYFSLNLSANSVMRGRLDARRTLKSLVADLRYKSIQSIFFALSCLSATLAFPIKAFCIATSLNKEQGYNKIDPILGAAAVVSIATIF